MKLFTILPILVLSFTCVVGSGRVEAAGSSERGSAADSSGGAAADASVVTLNGGLQKVATSGHEVQITREGENIASADVLIARSGFLPSIDASASHTTQAYQTALVSEAAVPIVSSQGLIVGQRTEKEAVPVTPINYYSYSASIQQTLYDFRRTASRYKESKEVLGNRKLDTARVRSLATLEFAGAYFDLLEAEKLVIVAQQEVERLDAHLKDAQSLYASGVITKNDLLQAEVRVKDGAQRLLSAENARAVQASRVNYLLVRPLERPVRVVDIEFKPEPPPFTLDEAWDIALKDRPEIQIVNGTLKALHLEEIAREADYYPVFFAKGEVDYQENQYLFHYTNWSATLGMSINLFSGGATEAQVARTRSQQDQVLKQRAKLLDDIRLEVKRYVLDLTNARERILVNRGAADQALENLRINRVRYDAGEGTATEVLDAVTLLTTAETNYIRAIYDFRRSEAGMYYAVGKDLREVYRQ